MTTIALPARAALIQRNWRPLYWLGAALLLLVLQILCGTAPLFAGLVFLFALFTYLTIKAVGGLDTLMGIVIAYVAAQHVLISQIAKICFWQPADDRLKYPLDTIGIYAVSMGAMWLAALASNWIGVGRRRALFSAELDTRHLYWLALTTTLLSFVRAGLLFGVGNGHAEVGGVLGPLNTLVFLPQLAIACGTAYTIRSSQGRRSIWYLNGSILLTMSILGVLGTTRVVILGPFVTYLLTCVAFRFRFRVSHFIALGVLLLVMQRLLFPLALISRTVAHKKNADLLTNWGAAVDLLVQAVKDPSILKDAQGKDRGNQVSYTYYDQYRPELERYSLIVVADAVIGAALTQGTLGMKTIEPGFLMLVPRSILPEKPFSHSDNLLAHRVPGLVNKDDVSTGITIGYIADAFSSFGWVGAVIIPFLIGFGYFTVFRFIIRGKIWNNVWALSSVLNLCWGLSEAPVEDQIVVIFQSSIITAIAFWMLLQLARAGERLQPAGRLLQHFDNPLRRGVRNNT